MSREWAELAEDPAWRRLLAAARRSLERTGGSLGGSISLTGPSEPERLAVIGVTGRYRSASSARLTVGLTELDDHLRATVGGGLLDVVEAATGPVRDRPAEHQREAAARDALAVAAMRSRHGDQPWFTEWFREVRRDGTLTRAVRGRLRFDDVLRVLDALPGDGEPLPAFADRVLHDTKALSTGPVRGVVLRAVAAWQGLPPPVDAPEERALWEAAGVVPDDLASQVLVLNLPASGGLLGSWLSDPRAAGVPLRITLHQLRREPLRVRCDEVFVCENPAVLRAAAGLADSRPLVCTEGIPSTAAHALLAAAGGCRILWRNDFDWTGVRVTAQALNRYPDARPWRMALADYRAGTTTRTPATAAGPALVGSPADTPWDPPLRTEMISAGRAVMEESLLPDLLADLCVGAVP